MEKRKIKMLTTDEVRSAFLDQVHGCVMHWERQPDCSIDRRLSGLAHSILVILDGESSLPAFKVVPQPHPDDWQYDIDNNDRPMPSHGDIAGCLHDEWAKDQPKLKAKLDEAKTRVA